MPMDAKDPEQTKAAAGSIAEQSGRLDVQVNSVAVPAFGEFLDLDKATFLEALNIKGLGNAACMQAAEPLSTSRVRADGCRSRQLHYRRNLGAFAKRRTVVVAGAVRQPTHGDSQRSPPRMM